MCGIAGYSLGPESSRRADARGAGAARGHRGARRRRRRLRASGRGRRGDASRSSAAARARCSTSSPCRRRPRASSSTCATTRRGTRRSRPTTTRSATASVVGMHNGVVANDDELLERYGIERQEPRDDRRLRGDLRARWSSGGTTHARSSELRGAMAAAWLDEREPGRSSSRAARAPALDRRDARRRSSSPRPGARSAIVEAALRARLERGGSRGPCSSRSCDGRVVRERRFRPDRRYREAAPRPPVRSPHEAVSCLERLAALASA